MFPPEFRLIDSAIDSDKQSVEVHLTSSATSLAIAAAKVLIRIDSHGRIRNVHI